jgi:Skp family chaperone for outer membrane proteins
LKKNFVALSALLLGVAALSQAQTAPPAASQAKPDVPVPTAAIPPAKVGVLHVQQAIIGTADGKKAMADLNAKYTPRKSVLEKKDADIRAKQDTLKKGGATMSADAKDKLSKEIEADGKLLQREVEDFQSDYDADESRAVNSIGERMQELLGKYCTANGLTMVLNITDPQGPVMWINTATDITQDIIRMYDAAYPPSAEVAPAKPAGTSPNRPASPPASAPKPPPTKK